MAKGPLVDDHVLLIPIEHSSSTLSLTPDGQREIFRFQCSLRKFCKTQGKEVVFFEWITKRGMHANLQARASAIKTIFNLAAKRLGFEFETIKNDDDASEGRELLTSKFDGQTGFFYVELPDGTVLGHTVEENENFPFQFGREVLSGLLKIPDKADWRNCKVSKDEEVQMVEAFKAQFKAFDPNEA